MEEIFTEIYEKALWDPEGKQPMSGWGSTLENCRSYILYLEMFFLLHHIQTIVDVGCGDWSFSRHINWGKRRYIGFDVVKSVVEKNTQLFGAENISFLQGNALELDLPEADLLLCKDVLMHLSNRDIFRMLAKMGRYNHCLVTNTIGEKVNEEIATGGFRPVDLAQAPFHCEGMNLFTFHTDHGTKQIFLMKQVR